MTKYEKLVQEANEDGITVESYRFQSERIKGLYCDGTVALNENIETDIEKACVLAEEIGHHHTATGNIIDMQDVRNIKQERQGRIWAYNKMIGLSGIILAYEHQCTNKNEMADYLDVTEEFLQEALEYYTQKYGTGATFGQYIIKFTPSLAVAKLY